jgi:DNA-binding response OmpR family regulator
MAKRSVFIVEDQADIRDVLREIFEMHGYRVRMASNGSEAWEIVKSNSFDLIISDLGIPGIDGLELVKRIRGNSIATPFLIITGVLYENVENELRALGKCDMLLKPFKIADIMKKISSLVAAPGKDSLRVDKP